MTGVLETAPGSTTPRAWLPMDVTDRCWAGVEFTRVHVGLDMPAPEQVRRALRTLATLSPEIGRWTTMAPPSWARLSADEMSDWLERVLRVSDERGASAARAIEVNDDPLGELPFRLVIGPDWLSLHQSHAIGDGQSVLMFLGQLLTQARSTEILPLRWTTVPARRRNRLIAHAVLRHLRSMPYVLGHRGELAGGTYEPAALRADSLDHVAMPFVSEPGFTTRLRTVRDEHFPQASVVGLTTVALRAALDQAIAPMRPGFECLYNTRSQADGTGAAWGNWSTGVYLRPADDLSPEDVTAAMRRARDLGLPSYAAAAQRLRGRRASGDSVQVVAPDGAPRLTMSYIREEVTTQTIPGVRVGEYVVSSRTRPNGLDSITSQAIEAAGRVALNMAFFPQVWSVDAVTRAVEAFFADPLDVVRGAQARRTRR